MNGVTGKVKMWDNAIIYIETDSYVVPVFQVHDETTGKQYYPVLAAYATTVHKVQGQRLKHVTIVFEHEFTTKGLGYTAISRVKELKNVVPLLKLCRDHFIPAL